MGPSDSRPDVVVPAGPLRFLDFSFPARRLQSPRGVRRLLSGVASPAIADFSISGSLVTPTLRNEAESSSLVLRLTGLPRRASAWGLPLSPPTWLHDEHLFVMLITFHINREARLRLTHRRRGARKERHGSSNLDRCTFSLPLASLRLERSGREFRLFPLTARSKQRKTPCLGVSVRLFLFPD
jgi:hypothetical protein